MKMSEIFVFTPKGEVKELPAGATPLDFAYMIHSDIGHHCIGARVNGRIVPLTYNLQTGDRVEILRSKNQTPHVGWVDVVVTARARAKIRQRLRELGFLEPADHDKDKPKQRQPRKPPAPRTAVREVDNATREKLIRVQGEKGMQVQFAKCCNPMPGHPVIGYVTRYGGLTIHRSSCGNFQKTTPDHKRIVKVSWEGEGHYEIGVRIKVTSRPNIVADVTEAIRPLVIDMTSATLMAEQNRTGYFEFAFNTTDQAILDQLKRTVRTVAGVKDIETQFVKEVAGEQ